MAHYSGAILNERLTVFLTRRSYFAPIIRALTSTGSIVEQKAFMVEAPGTAPGSAMRTCCVVYRYSQLPDTPYISLITRNGKTSVEIIYLLAFHRLLQGVDYDP